MAKPALFRGTLPLAHPTVCRCHISRPASDHTAPLKAEPRHCQPGRRSQKPRCLGHPVCSSKRLLFQIRVVSEVSCLSYVDQCNCKQGPCDRLSLELNGHSMCCASSEVPENLLTAELVLSMRSNVPKAPIQLLRSGESHVTPVLLQAASCCTCRSSSSRSHWPTALVPSCASSITWDTNPLLVVAESPFSATASKDSHITALSLSACRVE
jgi:hypothetical protein